MANTIKAGEQERSGLPRHIAIILDGNGRWAKKRRQYEFAENLAK